MVLLRLDMEVVPYTKDTALLAGRLDGEQRARGVTIPSVDLMIGATARHTAVLRASGTISRLLGSDSDSRVMDQPEVEFLIDDFRASHSLRIIYAPKGRLVTRNAVVGSKDKNIA